ncbi:zinc ABC transporter substrate-binding protein [Candidatus Sumerlaeota bacterium]|nr:zinc ABC transporter substrate-binding protein [Candidatus Sumerlaeota bacterium]
MKHIVLFAMLLTGVIALCGCGDTSPSGARKIEKIQAVSTIGQINDAITIIGGDRVEAIGLMGAGVDPHSYKASAGDLRKMSRADVIFYNGLHLEAKMGDVLEKLADSKRVTTVTQGIPEDKLLTVDNVSGYHDPHIWFDVPLWMETVRAVSGTLCAMEPEHAEEFKQRAEAYLEQLAELHQYVQDKAAELPEQQRILITAHDAFRYFGRAYGFKVMGLQGISTEAEAGTKDVQDLAKFVAENKIRAIFIESSVPERNIRAVTEAVRALGWEVKVGGELFSDALGEAGTEGGTYIGMVKHNIDTIVNALKTPETE